MSINIAPGYGQSTTRFRGVLRHGSTLEINIGEAFDMSVREIEIIETNDSEIQGKIAQIKSLIAGLETAQQGAKLRAEAEKLTDTAADSIRDRKWYSISTTGVLEAAKALGDVGVPVVAACTKLIELLGKAFQ